MRQRRVYGSNLGLVVVAALVLAATVLVRSDFSGAGDADVVELDSESSGYRIRLPGSLEDLSANADIVVVAQAIERGAETDVLLGESSPLGEKQVVHQITLPVVTYTLEVSEYLVGSGQSRIRLQVPLEVEMRDKQAFSLEGSRVWFLEYEPAWKLGGFSLNYGEGSVLTESAGKVRFGGPDGPVVPFLGGLNLASVADLVRSR
ncbi:MAG: hypothetical protein AB7N24_17000 [Dehalococcoidia bacterium]